MNKLKLLLAGMLTLTAVSTVSLAADRDTMLSSDEVSSLATIAAIDQNEILLGVMTLHKHPKHNVKKFAEMMIKQHGQNLTQITELAHQFDVGELSGGNSEALLADGQKDLLKLGALKGNQYNHAYVDAMVNGHEDALNLIKTKLMDTANTPEVKKFMTATENAVSKHLVDAKKVQKELK
jgi:putative membrane protein